MFRLIYVMLLCFTMFSARSSCAQEAYNTNVDSVRHLLVGKKGGWEFRSSEEREFGSGGNFFFVFCTDNQLLIYRTPSRSAKKELFIRTNYHIGIYNNLGQMGVNIDNFSGYIFEVLYQTAPANQLGTTAFWFLHNKKTGRMILQYHPPNRMSDYVNEFK